MLIVESLRTLLTAKKRSLEKAFLLVLPVPQELCETIPGAQRRLQTLGGGGVKGNNVHLGCHSLRVKRWEVTSKCN